MGRHRGFTLVELLIVIVVIAILAAISTVAYNGIQDRARDTTIDSSVATLKKALEFYRSENGSYPSVAADGAGSATSNLTSYLVPTYMEKMPDLTGIPQYVRGPGDAYALRIDYNQKTDCKTGVNVNTGWWGSALPACTQG